MNNFSLCYLISIIRCLGFVTIENKQKNNPYIGQYIFHYIYNKLRNLSGIIHKTPDLKNSFDAD